MDVPIIHPELNKDDNYSLGLWKSQNSFNHRGSGWTRFIFVGPPFRWNNRTPGSFNRLYVRGFSLFIYLTQFLLTIWKSSNDYRLTNFNLKSIRDLEMKIRSWPPTDQVDGPGRKDNLLYNLARQSVIRPYTQNLRRGSAIPLNTVLKRTHSDSQNHVLFPGSSNRDWDHMEIGPTGSAWMSQEYVPALRTLGEWRVVIVDSQIQYTIHTVARNRGARQTWDSKVVKGFVSLQKWRWALLWT